MIKKDFAHKTEKHTFFNRHKKFAICKKIYDASAHAFVHDGEWIHPKSSMIKSTRPCESLPNKFIYACPEGLIKSEEVPAYAGLIYTTLFGSMIVKQAPFLTKIKIALIRSYLESITTATMRPPVY
jgi:hypothetical protein